MAIQQSPERDREVIDVRRLPPVSPLHSVLKTCANCGGPLPPPLRPGKFFCRGYCLQQWQKQALIMAAFYKLRATVTNQPLGGFAEILLYGLEGREKIQKLTEKLAQSLNGLPRGKKNENWSEVQSQGGE